LKDAEPWNYVRINTNSKGIRGSREYPYLKPKDQKRILILGDSFAFGYGAPDHEIWPAYLDRLLPGTEVINAGVSGYGQDQMLLFFREEGKKYQPDIVVLGFVSFDMDRNMGDFVFHAKPKFELLGEKLKLTGVPVPAPGEVKDREFFRLKILDLMTMTASQYARKTGLYERKMKRLTEAILDQLVKESDTIGATTVFVYCPTAEDFKPYLKGASKEAYFLDYCARKNHLGCSARPYFIKAITAGDNIEIDAHWNRNGHYQVALAVRDYLVGKGLITVPDSGAEAPPFFTDFEKQNALSS